MTALDGSYIQKMQESIKFSEDNRKQAAKISKRVGYDERVALIKRHRSAGMRDPSENELAVVADTAVGQHGSWKVAVSNEQWGSRLATMYALAELVAAQREANELARKNIMLQQEILLELRRGRTASIIDQRRPEPPHHAGMAPPQQT